MTRFAQPTISRTTVGTLLGTVLLTAFLPVIAAAEPEPSRQLRNLHGFSKLYGYVRFFHPSDEAQQIDWEKFAVYGARKARHAPNADALRTVLLELYGPLAPSLRIYATGSTAPPAPPGPLSTDGLTAVAWQHRGPGLVPDSQNPELWASVRVGREDTVLMDPALLPTPQPGEEVDDPFMESLSFAMPIALWSDAEGTLPRGDREALAALKREVDAVDLEAWDARRPGDRAALGVIAWNIIEHFYPYFPELGVVWEQQHIIALRNLLEAHDARGTYDALRRSLWGFTGDAQARAVHHELDAGEGWLPVAFDQVEGYITVLASEVPGIRPGDDLETFDGDRAGINMQEKARFFAGSGQWKLRQALRDYGRGELGSTVKLELYRRGNIHNIPAEATRSATQPLPHDDRPAIDKLGGKIFYVDLRRASMAEIRPMLKKLASAKGVVFDLRGPLAAGNHALLSHLITEATTSADEEIPLVTWPAEQDEDDGLDGWERTTRWHIEPATPRIQNEDKRNKIVFLVDGRTVGEAEIFLDLVRYHDLGDLVGQQTAGAAGTLHHFRLPGGFELCWTVARFKHKDGERHFLTGFLPDVAVLRTPEGVQKQRDEVLDRALLHLRALRKGHVPQEEPMNDDGGMASNGDTASNEDEDTMANNTLDNEDADSTLAKLTEAARADLAAKLSVAAEDVGVVEARRVTWRDSGLGCPKDDNMYMQMVTEGALILLSAQEEEYRYHSNLQGPPFHCENPAPNDPLPDE